MRYGELWRNKPSAFTPVPQNQHTDDHACHREPCEGGDLVVKHESHHHVDLILQDPSIFAADALFLYPRRLNAAQRLSSPSKTLLDRILEALR